MKILNKSQRLAILFLASFCFVFAKCKKEDSLPSYYFRCKVNGADYRPNGCANCTQCDLLGDTTLIIGGNRDTESLGIGINDSSYLKTGSYFLKNVIGRRADYKNGTLTNDRYFTDANYTGLLVISKLDKSTKVIEGTFYFKAYNAFRGDSISVTEGKFRLKYTI